MGTGRVAGSLGSLVVCRLFSRAVGEEEGSPAWGAKPRATDTRPVSRPWRMPFLLASAGAWAPTPEPLCSWGLREQTEAHGRGGGQETARTSLPSCWAQAVPWAAPCLGFPICKERFVVAPSSLGCWGLRG